MMGRSAGAGSPIFFHCPVARRNREMWGHSDRSIAGRLPEGHDRIVRTGRTKPRPHRSYSAIGSRNMHTAHEYRCECGHVGWTTHRAILNYPVETPGHADDCAVMVHLLSSGPNDCTCGFDPS